MFCSRMQFLLSTGAYLIGLKLWFLHLAVNRKYQKQMAFWILWLWLWGGIGTQGNLVEIPTDSISFLICYTFSVLRNVACTHTGPRHVIKQIQCGKYYHRHHHVQCNQSGWFSPLLLAIHPPQIDQPKTNKMWKIAFVFDCVDRVHRANSRCRFCERVVPEKTVIGGSTNRW